MGITPADDYQLKIINTREDSQRDALVENLVGNEDQRTAYGPKNQEAVGKMKSTKQYERIRRQPWWMQDY